MEAAKRCRSHVRHATKDAGGVPPPPFVSIPRLDQRRAETRRSGARSGRRDAHSAGPFGDCSEGHRGGRHLDAPVLNRAAAAGRVRAIIARPHPGIADGEKARCSSIAVRSLCLSVSLCFLSLYCSLATRLSCRVVILI